MSSGVTVCNEAPSTSRPESTNPARRLAVVMGVCGSGKTVCGEALAGALGVPFADADTFHPEANVQKMAAGHPLTDEDRAPWLAAIGAWLHDHGESGAVVTCSALRRSYRDQLRAKAPGVPFLHLAGPAAVVTDRVAARAEHFMPSSLVESQYAILEPLGADEAGLTIDFEKSVDEIVGEMRDYLTSTRA